MNTMTEPQARDGNGNRSLPAERLQHYKPEVEQRVQGWLTSGELLVWIPILSQENFPDVPQQLLQFADRYQEAMRWPIRQPEDLLQLPDGISGWLMPATATDTDVACGVWAGEVYILGIKDRRSGKPQSLLGERDDCATDAPVADHQSPV
ncbi:hypothetical protein ACEOSV_29945 [Pseudomonas aeruginosa]|uniref:hypothetical protein n=1 Tax=Pseudomonas aeruginosa TaxID=287 RepID=UPI003766D8CE|nr:hypothetical protein [Pseudomonas aeruginosa]